MRGVCGGCAKLFRGKCKMGYEVIKGTKIKEFIRPNKCKKKYIKQAVLDKKNHKRLMEKLDDTFQMYIRYRDNWTCCVCGKKVEPSSEGAKSLMHAGHYIGRVNKTLRWDELNCHAQCRDCNCTQNAQGLDVRYTLYLLNKYRNVLFDSKTILEYLAEKKQIMSNFSDVDLEEKIAYYSEKLEKLKR
jgi:hypothetical protein